MQQPYLDCDRMRNIQQKNEVEGWVFPHQLRGLSTRAG